MSKWLSYIEEIIVVLVLVTMSCIAFTNVLTRNFFNLSLSFTEEITVNLFVFLTFIGAAIGVRKNAHLGFSLIVDKVSIPLRRIITVFIGVVSTILFLVLAYYGIDMIKFQIDMESTTPALGWPRWVFSLGIPIGTLLCAIRMVEATIREFKEQSHHQGGAK